MPADGAQLPPTDLWEDRWEAILVGIWEREACGKGFVQDSSRGYTVTVAVGVAAGWIKCADAQPQGTVADTRHRKH